MAKEKPKKIGKGKFTYKNYTIKQYSDKWIALDEDENNIAEGKSLHDIVAKH